MSVHLRREEPGDHAEVGELVRLAFDGRPNEPALVEHLRSGHTARPEFAMVAEHEGRLIGHSMLSDVDVVGDQTSERILILAPVSVHPEAQRRGVGSALVRCQIERATDAGELAIVVLGDPAYYARFGFEPSEPLGVSPPNGVPAEAFGLCLLQPDRLLRGTVRFPPVFEETGTL
jgi:putative acetyltransferase